MWSSERRRLLRCLAGLAGAGLAAGCGFTPVYAPGGTGARLNGQVLPAEPRNPLSYAFAGRLEERLGRNLSAPYRLDYTIDTNTDRLAITPSESTLRYHLKGTVSFSVVDQASEAVLHRGTVRNFTAYSAIGTTVATRASLRDAQKRLMILLADQVVTQLLVSGDDWLP